MELSRYKNSVVLVALLAGFSFQAGAVAVEIEGTDLVFSYDNSVYGDAFVVGNSLFFAPVDYLAVSANTDGPVTKDSPFALGVAVKPAVELLISAIHFAEGGDYRLDGDSSGVSVSGELDVTNNTGPGQTTAMFNAGSLDALNALTAWSVVDAIDLIGWAGASDITIDVTNTLEAGANALGDQAFVQKKYLAFAFEVSTVDDINAALAIRIPEPGMLALMLAGLAGILTAGRRKP